MVKLEIHITRATGEMGSVVYIGQVIAGRREQDQAHLLQAEVLADADELQVEAAVYSASANWIALHSPSHTHNREWRFPWQVEVEDFI